MAQYVALQLFGPQNITKSDYNMNKKMIAESRAVKLIKREKPRASSSGLDDLILLIYGSEMSHVRLAFSRNARRHFA